MPTVRNDSTGAETDTSLVGAPAAGKQVRVTSMYLSSSVQQTIFFESGSTVLWKQFCAIDGGQTHSNGSGEPLFVVPDATALTYTTTGANSFVSLPYQIADSTAP